MSHLKLTPIRCFLFGVIVFGAMSLLASALLSDIADIAEQPKHGNIRDSSGPFPGKELRQIHWFVQVCHSVAININYV